MSRIGISHGDRSKITKEKPQDHQNLTTFPTSKNSGSHLRTPINLIPFLNESSNTLVVGKTIENASGSRGKVEKWIPNKTLSSSTETMYAPI